MLNAATASPTVREIRAPKTVRAYTSRPRWSVPNQPRHEAPDPKPSASAMHGGLRRTAGSRAIGSDAKWCAKPAMSAIRRRTLALRTTVGLRRANSAAFAARIRTAPFG